MPTPIIPIAVSSAPGSSVRHGTRRPEQQVGRHQPQADPEGERERRQQRAAERRQDERAHRRDDVTTTSQSAPRGVFFIPSFGRLYAPS